MRVFTLIVLMLTSVGQVSASDLKAKKGMSNGELDKVAAGFCCYDFGTRDTFGYGRYGAPTYATAYRVIRGPVQRLRPYESYPSNYYGGLNSSYNSRPNWVSYDYAVRTGQGYNLNTGRYYNYRLGW